MWLLADIPGQTQMLDAAAQTENWVIVVLVSLIICILTAFSTVGVFGGRYVLKRLSDQDRYIQDTLVTVVKECTQQLSSNTEALHEYSKVSRELVEQMRIRPCQSP